MGYLGIDAAQYHVSDPYGCAIKICPDCVYPRMISRNGISIGDHSQTRPGNTSLGLGAGQRIAAGEHTTVIGTRNINNNFNGPELDLRDKPNSLVLDNTEHIFVRNNAGTDTIELLSIIKQLQADVALLKEETSMLRRN